ncbi:hypothetical protein EYF80_034192 [Liparis tanakae]|uniref:Uncharacterized protein n=1 Tax=Liparis tanakae TaxID=230148 RepID=A0A4Z2GR61_9TELE|nr:hypothetical protein EYF80_034192 [Liparis tanakae]
MDEFFSGRTPSVDMDWEILRLTQELVQSHLSPVHCGDVQRAAVAVARVEERQVEGRLFFPHRVDTFLRHGGGELVFGHLHDGVGVVGAMFPLGTQVPSLMDRYLDTRGEPLLALVAHRHLRSPSSTDFLTVPFGAAAPGTVVVTLFNG